MKKLFFIIFAFVLFIPFVFADEAEVISYQKLKNVTKHDHPAGSTLTMGFVGDEIRFLFFVSNQSEQTKVFQIQDKLPEYLIYQPGSAGFYLLGSGQGWQKLSDKITSDVFPLNSYLIQIKPDEGYYFKFSTHVTERLPKNNLTLSNFITISDENGVTLKQSVTKVLIPNSPIKKLENEKIDQQEQDYINQVLSEEQTFIEKTFFELQEKGFVMTGDVVLKDEKKVQNDKKNIPVENYKKDQSFIFEFTQILIVLGGVVILVFLYLFRHKK